MIECDGEDDHVHLRVHDPPKIALSKLVNSRNGVSSRRLRESCPEITGRYHKGVLWPPSSFAASCGGAPLSVIAEYVKSQREAAQGRSRVPPRPERRVSREVHDECSRYALPSRHRQNARRPLKNYNNAVGFAPTAVNYALIARFGDDACVRVASVPANAGMPASRQAAINASRATSAGTTRLSAPRHWLTARW
ncbi:IS200/IS605 family insertion sequence transposase protein (plasmid) [Rhizobium gallicum]|uniref:IS200/IS605 family insertion sequence transposase protein n=1 Tax=Rhizobium gallicum TaxID=56730 RepID=A0A1L5NVA5_9HYPH|nr:IS200/IS605 family insertion sequence transposase protein [Rhizobium gallicum]